MSDIASFVSRLSFDRVCPQGAIGIEVWGAGRDGAPNEALSSLVMNVDPQHGGGCWALTPFAAREMLPTARAGWLGSAAATVAQHRREYALAAGRYPGAAIWCPRWDCDALVAAMGLCGMTVSALPPMMRLAQLDALDSSADASRIDVQLQDCAAQCWGVSQAAESQWRPYTLAFGSTARAETVTDTEWGAVQALIRAGDFRGAADAAESLITTGDLPVVYHSVDAAETVARWYAEREACDAYVREHLEVHHGVACVAGAPQGAWAFALAESDWAVLSFEGRDGLAFSVAGSRRLPIERRSAILAAANEALTAAERAAGGSSHWAGAAGITGSRDAASVLSPREVAQVLSTLA